MRVPEYTPGRKSLDQTWLPHHVAGQILIFGAEPVGYPATDARPLKGDAAGVDAERRLKMIVMIAPHGADDAEVVGAFGDVGE
jgi:hypothetical protein